MTKWPVFDEEQIAAVSEVLRSGKVNAWTGNDVRAFEESYEALIGVKHAIALTNGSATLDVALAALEVQAGDEVIVTPRTFVASATCVLLRGAIPIFADVDRDTQNITPETIAPLITERTKGIIPVHLGGWPCDMASIMSLAKQHDLWVIEDCAQAHGAMIDGQHIGTFGTFGSFSFCQDKILTTGGEGGMLVTNDTGLWKKAWSYKDHGKDYDTVFNHNHPPGFRWLHTGVGTNLRMTGMSAALGLIQVDRLAGWIGVRTRNAKILEEACSKLDALRTPMLPDNIIHAWYRFYTFVRPDMLAKGWSRDRIVAEVTKNGFPIFSGSCSEVYREKVFADHGLAPAPLAVAKELGETSLAFLVDPTFSANDVQRLADCLTSVVKKATV